MRVIVTKPKNGKVDVTLDDKRGSTGIRRTQKDVPIAEVAAVVAPMCAEWEQRRASIRAARRGEIPF